MMKRYWINQPSKLQLCCGLHGLNVLADVDGPGEFTDVYFVTGMKVPARIPKAVLSREWTQKEYPNQIGELPE